MPAFFSGERKKELRRADRAFQKGSKMKNPREFLMYFVPSGEPEGPSVLRGDSIELKCFWVFLKHI